ncbi:MAG: oligosaccharide flippase family protein [Acidobacteria bacterium]|nr:oligosaccharide flippase family protein [Acidobacteriota bacterium]
MFSYKGQQSSLTSRAFWLLVAKTLAYAISFALPILLVRRLSQTEFGLYKQAFLVVNSAVALLPMGFMMSTYYFLPREPRERQGGVVTNVLLFYYVLGALGLLLLVLWPGFLTLTVGAQDGPVLESYAPLLGLAILFWMCSSFLEVVAIAHQEAQLATIFIVTAQLTKTGLLLAAAAYFGSVRSLLWAAILQGVIQAVILQVYLRSRFGPYWRSFDFGMLRQQLSYALPLGFAALLLYFMGDLHNYFVSNRYGAAAFASYSLGSFAMPLVGIIATSVSAVMIPRISQLQLQGASREITLTTARAMRKLAAIYFPIYAFLLVMGHEVIEFLFTRQYMSAWPVFAVNITLIPFLTLIPDPVMRAHKEYRFYMVRLRTTLVAALFATLWLWHLPPVGVMVVTVVYNLLDRFIVTFKSWRVVGATWRDIYLLKDLGKIAVAALIAALASELTRIALPALRPFFSLMICGIVFSLIYAACFALFGTISVEERGLLNRQLARVMSVFRGEPREQAL